MRKKRAFKRITLVGEKVDELLAEIHNHGGKIATVVELEQHIRDVFRRTNLCYRLAEFLSLILCGAWLFVMAT